jgi:hypothetical protein
MAAKSVHALAGPEESPTPPFIKAVLGVASNSAVNVPLCDAIGVFCHTAALVLQVEVPFETVTVTGEDVV